MGSGHAIARVGEMTFVKSMNAISVD